MIIFKIIVYICISVLKIFLTFVTQVQGKNIYIHDLKHQADNITFPFCIIICRSCNLNKNPEVSVASISKQTLSFYSELVNRENVRSGRDSLRSLLLALYILQTNSG